MADVCPKCGSLLEEPSETPTGRPIQRCFNGSWNKETKKVEGCTFVKWLVAEPKELDEKCPKCGSPVVLVVTRFGKKMKKCSTNSWNKETKKAEGCDFVEWIGGTTQELDEDCPQCGKKLVFYTTSSGKKMKKCSTAGWDSEKKVATGCSYIEWLKPGYTLPVADSGGEEFLPPEPAS